MRPGLGGQIVRYRYVYLLILPAIVFFVVYHYVPIYGITIAFKRYNAVKGILGSPWDGLTNFTRMFSTPDFLRVFRNTIVISLAKLVFAFPAPIIFALAINEIRHLRTKRVVQTISYLPHFMSWVVAAGIIREFLGMRGPVNALVGLLGMKAQLYLTNQTLFVPILVVTEIWHNIGWGSIVYLSAITGIDPQLYEAAEIDGAGRFTKIAHITLPSIMPAIIILFLLRVGHVMNAGFDQVFNLYNPIVYSVGDIIDTYVYRVGLGNLDFSYATAIGIFKNVLGLILLVVVNRVTGRYSEYGVM